MGAAVLGSRVSTNLPLSLSVSPAVPAAASAVVAIRDGGSAQAPLPLYLDFGDSTFKTVGWATRQAAMVALGGNFFALDGGLDVQAITNLPDATMQLIAEYEAVVGGRTLTDNDPITLDGVVNVVLGAMTYDDTGPAFTITFDCWIERSRVTSPSPTAVTLDFFDPTIVPPLFSEARVDPPTPPDAQGHYVFTHTLDQLDPDRNYYARITMTDPEGTVVNDVGFPTLA